MYLYENFESIAKSGRCMYVVSIRNFLSFLSSHGRMYLFLYHIQVKWFDYFASGQPTILVYGGNIFDRLIGQAIGPVKKSGVSLNINLLNVLKLCLTNSTLFMKGSIEFQRVQNLAAAETFRCKTSA